MNSGRNRLPGKTKNRYALILGLLIQVSFFSCGSRSLPRTTLNVALCQIFCLDGDREGNFHRLEEAVLEAKHKGADMACFPETCLLGWVNPEAHQRSYPIPGKDSHRLCELARRAEIFLCVGLAEKAGQDLFDSVVLIDDRGNLLAKHRKINILTELMDPPYSPGNDIAVTETEYGRIGLMVCADTFRLDLLQRMREFHPHLVLVPYGWAAEEEQWPQHGEKLQETIVKAAREIGAPVVGTDLVGQITHGPWTGLVYGGQSLAAESRGFVLGKARDRDREIRIITIPLSRRLAPGRQ